MFDAGREPDRPGAFRGEETVPLAESPPRSASLERPDSARLPDQIGPYKILKILGEGGMGVVYLAVDSKLGRNVAIKMVADEFSDDPDRLALLEREARTAAHLNHPNIATVYELGEFDGSYFIAMEYLEGRTLSKLLHRPQPISLPEFLDIAVQIAHGLTAAHGNKVIHRDLKPANVMITNEGRVKILDFGLAKALQTEAAAATWLGAPGGSTGMSAGFGTPGYSSPEQCRGERVDVRCDLFSFGVVLYQMATGVAPFERPDLPSTISAVVNEEPPPPAVVNSDLPSGLGDLIAKLMAKRPEDRYQSSAEVLADLEEIERQVKEGRGRRTAFMVVLGAAVVLLAIVLVMRPPPKPALAGDFESLVIYLADGRFPEAEELVVNIKALDQGGPRSEKAQELLDEALTLQIWTDDLDQAIQDNLAADSLVEAWKGIERLSKKRFKDDDFKPATERAIELTLKLVGKLEFESREVLESQPGFPISRLEPIITLLEKVAPENNYLRDLRASVAHSHLQQLHDKARPGMTPVDLRDIIRQMDKIDRSSALTATVWLMHEIRRQQTTSFEEGLKEFKEASLVGLAT
ncbi:MAG: serine/threonine-protein kinase, partial [Planctomycetota bacterium]|nr:serine/threonine-protein kinase [Planctomycetota bacterium]